MPTTSQTFSFQAGQTVSDPFQLSSFHPTGFDIPAEFEGTQFSFQIGPTDTGPWKSLRDTAGALVTAVVVADSHLGFYADGLKGKNFCRLVSNNAVVPERPIVVWGERV